MSTVSGAIHRPRIAHYRKFGIGSARFGSRYGHCVDPVQLFYDHASNRTSGVRQQVRTLGQSEARSRETRYVSWTYKCPLTFVFWTENPCVGGSIPPQATTFTKAPLAYASGAFFMAAWRAIAAQAEASAGGGAGLEVRRAWWPCLKPNSASRNQCHRTYAHAYAQHRTVRQVR